jgi:hypothetical protein
MKLVFTLLVCLYCARCLGAQPHQKSSPDAARFGAKIFRSHCAECHGLNGEGGRGPDLTRALSATAPAIKLYSTPSLSRPSGGVSVAGNASSGAKLFRGRPERSFDYFLSSRTAGRHCRTTDFRSKAQRGYVLNSDDGLSGEFAVRRIARVRGG